MRRQDEVLFLYPRADPEFRLILLDLAGDLNPVHDSGAIEALLANSLESSQSWMRIVAGLADLSFAAAWVPASLRIAAPVAGTWSLLHRVGGAPSPIEPLDEAARAKQAMLQRALLYVLQPLSAALTDQAQFNPTTVTLSQIACLSHLPVPATVDALRRGLASTLSPELALGLAACATQPAAEALLSHLCERSSRGSSQTLVGLRYLGSELAPALDAKVVAVLEKAIATGNRDDLAAVAMALPGSRVSVVNALASRMATRADAWATCHLLIALARAGCGLDTAIECHDRSSIPIHKTLAVRAAGSVTSDAAKDFLWRVVRQGTGNAQALALELLARRESAIDAAFLDSLLVSPHWRVRLNAALLMAAQDPDRALPVLVNLLTSGVDVERASGVFALAYLQNAEKVLLRFLDDPSSIVRAEAISSLARHTGGESVKALVKAALGQERALALRALQALAWRQGEGIAGAIAHLSKALDQHTEPAWRSHFYRMLGALAAGASLQPVSAFSPGLGASDPEEVLGCLDGLIIAGIPIEEAQGVTYTHKNPIVQAHVAFAGLLQGRLDQIPQLVRLALSEGPGRAQVFADLRWLGNLSPYLGRSGRLAALEKALLATVKQPGYKEFSGELLDLSLARWVPPHPLESDPIAGPRPNPPRLPTRAVALVDVARPLSKTSPGLRTGYYSPLPLDRRRQVGLGAIGLLSLMLLGWITHRRVEAPVPIAVSRDTVGREVPLRVMVGTPGRPGVSSQVRSLGSGESLHVESGHRAWMAGPYPGPHVEIDGGDVLVVKCQTRPNRRLGCDLHVKVKEGTYRVDTRPGNSTIAVEAPGQKLTGTGAHFTLEVGSDGGSVKVHRGKVKLASPETREVSSGQAAKWGRGAPSESADR